MLINLLPDFFAVLDSTDRLAAYQRYFAAHRRILEPYWHNYVIDPDSPHFVDIVRSTPDADRTDLRAMLERTDVVALARSDRAAVPRAARAGLSTSTSCSWSASARRTPASSSSKGRASRSSASSISPALANPQTEGSWPRSRADSALAGARDRARRSLHVADEPKPAAAHHRGGGRLLLVLGHWASRDAARASRQRRPRRTTFRAPSVRATPRGSTSATSAGSTPTSANSRRSWLALSPGTSITRARPAPAISVGRHERRSANGRPLRASRAQPATSSARA